MNSSIVSQSRFFGRALYFFAVYTVLIKYLLPVAWALRQNVSPVHYIYFWDAWWIAHLIVGFYLARAQRGIWKWALLLAGTEIGIIAAKFWIYFQIPDWDFWHLNWLVNKTGLLIYFIVLLVWLLRRDVQEVLREKKFS